MSDRAQSRAAESAAFGDAAPDLATPKSALDSIVSNPPFGRYPGGKNGAGVFQRLINLMPPHRVYVEAFLGSGAIMRRKRPAAINVGIDVDRSVIGAHRRREGFTFICGNALDWLARQTWRGDELVYCDPPYLGTARGSARPIYRHEMLGEAEHVELLRILAPLPAMVMLSGYASELYDRTLAGWRRVEFQAMTRGGLATEVVWLNFPEPARLHDYRFLGEDFHDRGRIARKLRRWVRKLEKLPVLERAAILDALNAGQQPRGCSPAAASPDAAIEARRSTRAGGE